MYRRRRRRRRLADFVQIEGALRSLGIDRGAPRAWVTINHPTSIGT